MSLEAWEHATGCPVVLDPTEENRVRVETYVMESPDGTRKRVTRCSLCGAARYETVEEEDDAA